MHQYIANFQYYEDIKDLTFKSWFDLVDVPDWAFPIVIKGRTNSRKHRFSTQMYAANRRDAAAISHELKDDVLIGPQGLVYRQYAPLKVLEVGINGCKFTNEWREFVLYDSVVAIGYYWSQLDDSSPNPVYSMELASPLSREVIRRLRGKCNFYTIDVAEKENGEWIVVELNDGQMSGLSTINPREFYSSMDLIVKSKR